MIESLPSVNAALNMTSATFLCAGYAQIRRKNVPAHRFCMLGAFASSTAFLASYLTRVGLTGTHADPHHGAVHVVYLVILLTHMTLASAVPVLAIILLVRAFKERFAAHRRLARYTYPIWLYVSVTGVIVYVMLYHLPA